MSTVVCYFSSPSRESLWWFCMRVFGCHRLSAGSAHLCISPDITFSSFHVMRWTREHGGARYDPGGIISEPRPSGSDVNSHSSGKRGSNLDGVTQFKLGFGGEIVAYPPTLERRYHPALSWVVRRFHPRLRQGRAGA